MIEEANPPYAVIRALVKDTLADDRTRFENAVNNNQVVNRDNLRLLLLMSNIWTLPVEKSFGHTLLIWYT